MDSRSLILHSVELQLGEHTDTVFMYINLFVSIFGIRKVDAQFFVCALDV